MLIDFNPETRIKIAMQQGFLFTEWPKELKQLFFAENNLVRLEELTPDSPKKVWWKCEKGSDHIWLEAVSIRYQEREKGCPYCRGEKLSETNNLAKLYPELAKQLLSQYNEGQTAGLFLPNSPKKIWWKCAKGEDHLWQESIKNRVQQDRGCPFCAGEKVSATNCLNSLYPELAKQWHREKNLPLSPEQVKPDTSKRVWWQCSKGEDHEWEESIKNRVQQDRGCPFCMGNQVSLTNCLAALYPKLAEEWCLERNEGVLPDQVLPSNKKKVWWKCAKGEDHLWSAPIADRVKSGKKGTCPFCTGVLPSLETSFAGKHPVLAQEWHPTKNETLLPTQIFPNLSKKVWWKCEKGEDHEWEATVKARVEKGEGCPFCAGYQLSITNCFGTLHPELAKEWHSKKNTSSPQAFFPQDHTIVWWKCEVGRDHEWEASIASRLLDASCPFCTGSRLSEMNSFAAKYPSIASEWHNRYNKKVKPSQFLPESDVLVWWQCTQNAEHIWMDSILKRVQGAGCFDCQIVAEMKKLKKRASN